MKNKLALITLTMIAVSSTILTGCNSKQSANNPDGVSVVSQVEPKVTPTPAVVSTSPSPLPSSTNINDFDKEVNSINIENEDFTDLSQ